jgi:hypothetical protein
MNLNCFVLFVVNHGNATKKRSLTPMAGTPAASTKSYLLSCPSQAPHDDPVSSRHEQMARGGVQAVQALVFHHLDVCSKCICNVGRSLFRPGQQQECWTRDPLGSFGCLIASKSMILANNGGQAYGANPRSFRAKGYGMLAIL